ncbi:MAG: hypothetical protein WA173_19760 [Pseudomonas sp.]|uniref:hypothetical protein n=1 Tax=Pseudomonas sp. TaxID=306 RepID=UPI003BB62A02
MTTLKWLAMIFMLNLLMTGCSCLYYPAPIPAATKNMTGFLEGTDKEIIAIQWMKSDFSVEITNISAGDTVGLLIKTKGYAHGEKLTVEFDDKNTNDDGGSYTITRTITGIVDKHGEVRALIKS